MTKDVSMQFWQGQPRQGIFFRKRFYWKQHRNGSSNVQDTVNIQCDFKLPFNMLCFHHQTHPNWVSFPLWLSLFILSGAISSLFPSSVLAIFWPGGLNLWCHILFAFSYCVWGSCGKNCGAACHSLFQWTTFCQKCPLWPVHFRWSCTAWLIVSLSYASPFTKTRLWSTKGVYIIPERYRYRPKYDQKNAYMVIQRERVNPVSKRFWKCQSCVVVNHAGQGMWDMGLL